MLELILTKECYEAYDAPINRMFQTPLFFVVETPTFVEIISERSIKGRGIPLRTTKHAKFVSRCRQILADHQLN